MRYNGTAQRRHIPAAPAEDPMRRFTSTSQFPARLRAALALACMLAAAGLAPLAARAQAPDGPDSLRVPAPGLRAALQTLTNAWEAGDHLTVARLVAADGALIDLVPESPARSRLSPDQAHYYFKTLFQSVDDGSFRLRLLPHAVDEAVAHAVGRWRYVRSGRDRDDQFFVTLELGDEGWRLTEIRCRP